MEVHHHSHTDRKKWKHYFWEFFMLFLAVTLGFLVENQREHYIEHQREKKYAQLLYEDLKKDSASLNAIIGIKQWRGVKLDSLFHILSLPDLQKNGSAVYYYSSFLALNLPFKPNDATIQQLRSSGSLRYFSNPQLYNAISKYYSDCMFYLDRENEGSNSESLLRVGAKIFDANKLYSFIQITPSIKNAVHYPTETMELLTTDKEVINEFTFLGKRAKNHNDLALYLLRAVISPQLNELITEIKTKYHLK